MTRTNAYCGRLYGYGDGKEDIYDKSAKVGNKTYPARIMLINGKETPVFLADDNRMYAVGDNKKPFEIWSQYSLPEVTITPSKNKDKITGDYYNNSANRYYDSSYDPNGFMDFMNAATLGIGNRLSVSQNARLVKDIYDASTGNKSWEDVVNSAVLGNNGIFVNPYANMALDIVVPTVGGKYRSIANVGKGIANTTAKGAVNISKSVANATKNLSKYAYNLYNNGTLWDRYTTFRGRFGNYSDNPFVNAYATTARRFGLPDKARIPADATESVDNAFTFKMPNLSYSTSLNTSTNRPYYLLFGNNSGNMMIQDIKKGRNEFVNWMNNPKYREAAELNKLEAAAMGLSYTPTYEKPQYSWMLKYGIKPEFKSKMEGEGATSWMGALEGTPTSVEYNLSSKVPYDKVTRHEVGHVSLHGNGKNAEELKYLRYKTHLAFKDDANVGPYDFHLLTGEAAMNGRDLGADLGISVGLEYPGYLKALNIINSYYKNSNKAGMVNVLKLDKDSMPYVWKLLNGTLLGGTAFTTYNLNNNGMIYNYLPAYINGKNMLPGFKGGFDSFANNIGQKVYIELKKNGWYTPLRYDNIMSLLSHESAYGTSNLARNYHNYGGRVARKGLKSYKGFGVWANDDDFVKDQIQYIKNRPEMWNAKDTLSYAKAGKKYKYFKADVNDYASLMKKQISARRAWNAAMKTWGLPKLIINTAITEPVDATRVALPVMEIPVLIEQPRQLQPTTYIDPTLLFDQPEEILLPLVEDNLYALSVLPDVSGVMRSLLLSNGIYAPDETNFISGLDLPGAKEGKNPGIHIKPSHRGRFTLYLKSHPGMTAEKAKHSKSAAVRKMATFALNARKWRH